MKYSRRFRHLSVIAGLLAAAPAWAEAGRVLFALGAVDIERAGAVTRAQRGTPVEVGDSVRTGPAAHGHLRLRDGALLALRPNSTVLIEAFDLPASATPGAFISTAEAPGGGAGRSVMRILKGGFRTITGLIGRSSSDDYRVITPVATIGIRGTDFSAVYCNADCGGAPDGLHTGVTDGAIVVANDSGALELGASQYGYVEGADAAPEEQLAPPDVLETPIAPTEGEAAENADEAPVQVAEAAAEAPPPEAEADNAITAVEQLEPEVDGEIQPVADIHRPVAFAGPADSDSSFVAANTRSIDPLTVDADTLQLEAFSAGHPDVDGLSQYLINTAQNVNLGVVEELGLRWGRWTGGAATVVFPDGSTGIIPLGNNESLHWIYGPQGGEPPMLAITGSRTYVLVGNTNPTDNLGNIGVLNSATLSANFTNQTVASSLNININSQIWNASGAGDIASGTATFDGAYAVTVNGASTGNSGEFGGFFTSPEAAGLGYSLSSSGATVSGVAAFGPPSQP